MSLFSSLSILIKASVGDTGVGVKIRFVGRHAIVGVCFMGLGVGVDLSLNELFSCFIVKFRERSIFLCLVIDFNLSVVQFNILILTHTKSFFKITFMRYLFHICSLKSI